ncbi:MAG: vWA domain-containing protein [Opitutales bacterium]
MKTFIFQHPEAFWLLLVIPLIALLRGRFGKGASIRFSTTAIARGIAGLKRSRAGAVLLAMRYLGLACLITALARPQFASTSEEVEASGIDIVLAVDVSISMLGLDFTIDGRRDTRLEAVKVVIADFIRKRPYDRIGLVAFAGNPYLVSPLTLNHSWLELNLERFHVGMVPPEGTAIGSAIGMSVNRLRDLEAESRVVILLTDGENTAGQISPTAAAEAAATYGVKIYTIGAGTNDRVLYPRYGQNYEILRGRDGEPLPQGYANFPVDEEALREVADTTGARFFRATDTQELKAIYDEIDRLEKTEVTLRNFSSFEELFAWALIPGVLLIFLEQLLGQTRFRRLP